MSLIQFKVEICNNKKLDQCWNQNLICISHGAQWRKSNQFAQFIIAPPFSPLNPWNSKSGSVAHKIHYKLLISALLLPIDSDGDNVWPVVKLCGASLQRRQIQLIIKYLLSDRSNSFHFKTNLSFWSDRPDLFLATQVALHFTPVSKWVSK